MPPSSLFGRISFEYGVDGLMATHSSSGLNTGINYITGI